jgi:hypothetical protein
MRARPLRMLHVHAHEAARARCPLPRLPDSVDSAPAEARRNLRWPSARASERAATLVSLTACALLPRCRQPRLRAVGHDGHLALDISATTGRCNVDHHGHKRIRPPSRPRSPAWPSLREASVPVKPVPVKPGAGVLEAAAPSAHCSARSPSTAAPSTPSWSLLVIGAMRTKALPRRRRLSARVHHITASRTTPAPTHPCSSHLHLHRSHHTLTSPPATRSPLPLHRPCPS